jgi:hypothetical protein
MYHLWVLNNHEYKMQLSDLFFPYFSCFAGLCADSLTVDDYQGWWNWILALFCEIKT